MSIHDVIALCMVVRSLAFAHAHSKSILFKAFGLITEKEEKKHKKNIDCKQKPNEIKGKCLAKKKTELHTNDKDLLWQRALVFV